MTLLPGGSFPKFNEFAPLRDANQPFPRCFLLERPRQRGVFRGDDREQVMSARQAAEALFKPKSDVGEQPASDPPQSAKPRKPRVLPTLPSAPLRQETVNVPTTSGQPTAPEISETKLGCLRTLLK
jgi:hypothetical protein